MTATELLRDELTLSPARAARMLRMTTVVALVVVISMALRVPEVAVSAYMIFFFAQRDVATTLLTGIAAVIGLTVALVLCFLCFLVTVDEPGLRLPLMVVLAFGGVQLRDDPVRGIDRDREAQRLRARNDRGIDADHLRGGVHQRSSRIAWIEGRVGLDQVLDQASVARGQ